MKVRNITAADKTEFKPVTLELTFETPEELIEFWHRLNQNYYQFLSYEKGKTPNLIAKEDEDSLSGFNTGNSASLSALWGAVDKIVEDQNLKLWREKGEK